MRVFATLNPAAFEEAVERQAEPRIEDALFELRGIFAEEFGAPKTGRIYRRPSGAEYRASAPGQPPAIRSGELLRSISQPSVTGTTGRIEIAAPYARFLEEGTPRMRARPFVRPAIDLMIERFMRRRG